MPPRKSTVEKARILRRAMTPPEVRLWSYLRTRPDGVKFRRQHPAGPYILDFYCAQARLGIEVDGDVHGMGARAVQDARRDDWLAAQGFRVVRVPARDVMADLDAVVRYILDLAHLPLHHPSDGPPPHAGHGEDNG